MVAGTAAHGGFDVTLGGLESVRRFELLWGRPVRRGRRFGPRLGTVLMEGMFGGLVRMRMSWISSLSRFPQV